MEFVRVATVSEIPAGRVLPVKAGSKNLLLASVEGKVYSFDSRCPHVGLSLEKGRLEGSTITCPHHGSRFDVTTGKLIKGPSKKDLPTYEVRVEGDGVLVGV